MHIKQYFIITVITAFFLTGCGDEKSTGEKMAESVSKIIGEKTLPPQSTPEETNVTKPVEEIIETKKESLKDIAHEAGKKIQEIASPAIKIVSEVKEAATLATESAKEAVTETTDTLVEAVTPIVDETKELIAPEQNRDQNQ